MTASFKNILIPVDLSANTETALAKALEFAVAGNQIHLFHVLQYSRTNSLVQNYFNDLTERPAFKQAEIKLNQWRDSMYKYKNNITVFSWIVEEKSIQKAIMHKAYDISADLIIVVKQKHHTLFSFSNIVNPASLSRESGIAVLSLKKGIPTSKAMVLPLINDKSLQERELISIISRKFVSKIYLVTFSGANESINDYTHLFLQTYQWLKTIHFNVEHEVLVGSDKIKAVLNFADKVNADTLLFESVNTKKESFGNRMTSKWHQQTDYILGAG